MVRQDRRAPRLTPDATQILLTAAEQSTTVADGLAAGAPGADQLWEDNWDDDDIEDDFQKQLRQAIAERSGGDEAMKE